MVSSLPLPPEAEAAASPRPWPSAKIGNPTMKPVNRPLMLVKVPNASLP
jgi:hypothetical protein